MIDEGLWLVCYVSGGINGHCFTELEAGLNGEDLVNWLKKAANRENLVVTNMVRLGDLKEDKDGTTTNTKS
jgi:hypothetical protein